jgi:mitochondrial inner membrane protease ATP23
VHILLKRIEGLGCSLAPEPIACEDSFGSTPVAGG